MHALLAAPERRPILAQLAFTGTIPVPLVFSPADLVTVRDTPPSIGPVRRPDPVDDEIAGAMSTWISTTHHTRPFWRDPDFVAEFGRATRAELRAAVDELLRRAEDAARVARMPIAWAAQIPNPEIERTAA